MLSLWICLEYWAGGPFSYLEVHDVGDCPLPRGILLARQWWEHGLTYWVPAMTAGADRLANGGSFASPASVLLLFLPAWLGFATLQFGFVFISTYFTYRVCRDNLELDHVASLFAGATIAFVHGQDVLAHQWGYAALPLILWSLKRAERQTGAVGWLLMIPLGLVYGFISSAVTSLPFCFAGIASWFILVDRRVSAAFWLKFAVFCASTTPIHLHSIWAMWLNGPQSHRASWGKPAPSWPIFWGFLSGALSNLFSFKIPLTMTAASLIAGRKADSRTRGMLGLLLACTVGVALLNFALLFLSKQLGFLNGFQFGRFALLAQIFATLSGALGLAALPEGGRLRRGLLALACVWLLGASLVEKGASLSAWLLEGDFTANLGGEIRSHLPASSEPCRVATIPHGIHPAYAHAEGLETVDGYNNLYPKTYQRFWEHVIEPAGNVRGMSSMLQLLREWGNRVYLILDEAPRFPARLPFDAYYRLNLLSLANMRYVASLCPLEGRDLVAVHEPPAPPVGRWAKGLQRIAENFSGRRRVYVYENRSALPRAFIARRVRSFADETAFWSALDAAPAAELRETVFARGSALALSGPPAKRAQARIVRYSPDRIEVALDLDGAGVLVLSNNLSPFWKVSVDGASRPIMPAYETFWGVAISKAERNAVFTYEPPYRLNRP